MSAVSEKYQRLWALEQLVADPELSFDDLERILEAFPEEELEPLQARVFLRALEDHIGTHRINSHTAMILRSLEAVLPLRVPHGERLVPPPNLHTVVRFHAAMHSQPTGCSYWCTVRGEWLPMEAIDRFRLPDMEPA